MTLKQRKAVSMATRKGEALAKGGNVSNSRGSAASAPADAR